MYKDQDTYFWAAMSSGSAISSWLPSHHSLVARYCNKDVLGAGNGSSKEHESMSVQDVNSTSVQNTNSTALQKILQRWSGWSIPPAPLANAAFEAREKSRRARAASHLLLLMIVLMSFTMIVSIFMGNIPLLIISVAILPIIFVQAWLNRRGRTDLVALSFIAATTIGTFALILSKPGGITLNGLRLYDNLIASLLLAVMLLPIRSIFYIAAINLLLVVVSLYLFASSPVVDMLRASFLTVIYPFVFLEGMVVVLCWLWGTNMIQALQRADRAEEIAKLEQAISAQNWNAIKEKRKLEIAIEAIMETHIAVANGNYNIRVPLKKDNVLWPLAGALNNLLGRIQGWRRDSVELEKLQTTTSRIIKQIWHAKQTGRQPLFDRTGTMLDPLLSEFKYLRQVDGQLRRPRLQQLDSQLRSPVPHGYEVNE